MQSAELKRYFGEATRRVADSGWLIGSRSSRKCWTRNAKRQGIHVGDLLTKAGRRALPERVRRQASLHRGVNSTRTRSPCLPTCSERAGRFSRFAYRQQLMPGARKNSAQTQLATFSRRWFRNAPVTLFAFSGQEHRLPGYGSFGRRRSDRRLRSLAGYGRDYLRPARPISSERSIDRLRLTSRSNVTAAIVNGPVLLEPDAPHAGSDSYSASYFSSSVIHSSELAEIQRQSGRADRRANGRRGRAGRAVSGVRNQSRICRIAQRRCSRGDRRTLRSRAAFSCRFQGRTCGTPTADLCKG